jgi:hypothetical protein
MQYEENFPYILPTNNRHFIRPEKSSNKLMLNG